MTRARASLLLVALTACAAPLLVAPDAEQAAAQEQPPQAPAADGPAVTSSVVLALAGESQGHLEPCNCVADMQGGFPRRLAALARLRRGPAPSDPAPADRAPSDRAAVLSLDTGDLSAGDQNHPALLTAKTRAALELLRRAEVPAVAVGELDLRLGLTLLQRLARRAGVTLLLANARRPGSEEAPFAPSLVLAPPGGPAVLVAAALDPDLGDPSGELELLPPGPPLRAALQAAPTGALRVVLFHGPSEAARRLPADLPADVIVCGHGLEAPGPLARHGRSLLIETQRDARSLALLRLAPGQAPALERVPLGGDVPDDAWARERVDAYYEEVKDLPEPPRKPAPEGGSFLGAESCRACHAAQWEVFAQSKHHGAQARIAARDPRRAALGECTRCHVTGWGYEGGFESLATTPHLAEVGCEACHGVGEAHLLAPPDRKRGYGVRTGFPGSWEATCRGCHDPANSPGFDFSRALEAIRHWRPRPPK